MKVAVVGREEGFMDLTDVCSLTMMKAGTSTFCYCLPWLP